TAAECKEMVSEIVDHMHEAIADGIIESGTSAKDFLGDSKYDVGKEIEIGGHKFTVTDGLVRTMAERSVSKVLGDADGSGAGPAGGRAGMKQGLGSESPDLRRPGLEKNEQVKIAKEAKQKQLGELKSDLAKAQEREGEAATRVMEGKADGDQVKLKQATHEMA